jgi:hypothetical protein
MPTALIEAIDSHRGGLHRALDRVEALVGTPTAVDELVAAIETVRRKLLAHKSTSERLVVHPLRHLRLLDPAQLAVLGDELDQLSRDAVRLTSRTPDARAVAAFVIAVRDHIEREARAVVPAARSALADGRLSAVPRWYVEEVYGRQGDPEAHWADEWLG